MTVISKSLQQIVSVRTPMGRKFELQMKTDMFAAAQVVCFNFFTFETVFVSWLLDH